MRKEFLASPGDVARFEVVSVVDGDLLPSLDVPGGLQAARLTEAGALDEAELDVGVEGVVGLVPEGGAVLDDVALRAVQVVVVVVGEQVLVALLLLGLGHVGEHDGAVVVQRGASVVSHQGALE